MKISWKNRSSSVHRRGSRSSRYRKFLIELLESRHLLSADSFGDFRWLPSILEAKEGPMSNLDTSLVMVYREYSDYVRAGKVGDFQPTAKMLQVFDDKIAVDLVSQAETVGDSFLDPHKEDAVTRGSQQLAQDILELGGQIEGRSGPIVSAMIPIDVLPQISQLLPFVLRQPRWPLPMLDWSHRKVIGHAFEGRSRDKREQWSRVRWFLADHGWSD